VIAALAPLFLLAAVGWLALLLAAPRLPAAASALTYGFGSLICHQLAARSFHVGAYQLPVCARCFGIYAGVAAGAAIAAVGGAMLARLGPRQLRRLMAGSALPTAVTVAAEWAGVWHTSNAERCAAGVPLGVAVAVVVAATLHYGECARRPPITSPQPR
jgi:uncharacterized membrane protein